MSIKEYVTRINSLIHRKEELMEAFILLEGKLKECHMDDEFIDKANDCAAEAEVDSHGYVEFLERVREKFEEMIYSSGYFSVEETRFILTGEWPEKKEGDLNLEQIENETKNEV